MPDLLSQTWAVLVAVFNLALSVGTSGHAILYKRDPRSAIGWVGIIWLVPVVGGLLYLFFGINRVHRRARLLRAEEPQTTAPASPADGDGDVLRKRLGADGERLQSLAGLVGTVTERPLPGGNRVQPLDNGDAAYPAMLEAIGNAERSISLSTYIFDNDRTGQRFLDALVRAVARGVAVRVLIDDVGARYSWPSMARVLRRAGVPVATFIRTLLPGRFRYSNLRNHRKILVADGQVGFTGGANIRGASVLQEQPAHPIADLHFRLDGPVVQHLQEVFAEDWHFATGETLGGEPWFPRLTRKGTVAARGISDGPDADFDKLRMTLLGAITCATRSVQIVTPYFLPDAPLATALNVAALRGVEVDIVMPEKGNLRLVQWASTATLWQVLENGCRVWLSPPPFDHTKLMVVDGLWSLIGSANWDPRSLRLNFEFNVECYDRPLAEELEQRVRSRIDRARRVTLADVEGRPLPVKLRDGIARLATPYL